MNERVISNLLSTEHALSTTPDVWAEVARGELSAREAAEQLHGQEPTDLIERSVRLFEPPSSQQQEQRLEQLLRTSQARRPRKLAMRRWATSLSLVAAVLLVFALRGLPPRPIGSAYEIEFSQSIALTRCEPGSGTSDLLPTYLLDREILVRLSPHSAVEGPVDVVVFGRAADVSPRRLGLVVDHISDQGVINLSGIAREVGLDVGQWQLTFVIGRPGALPSTWEELRSVELNEHQTVRAALKVASDPPEDGV